MDRSRITSKLVLYTCLNDLSLYGGIETMIPQEASWLSSRGYKVHILSRPPVNKLRFELNDKVQAIFFPKIIMRFPWLPRDLLTAIWISIVARRLSKNGGLVSVSFSSMDGAGPALAKLFGSRIHVVVRVVGPLTYEVEHFAPAKKFRYKVYARLFRLPEAFSYLVADRIIAISEFELDNIRSYGIDERKVRLIRCGIDSAKYGGRENRHLLGIPDDEKVVMFVGRFVEKNGPLVIADAIDGIARRIPKVRFVFVGHGVLRQTLEEKLAPHQKSGRVIFTGYRSDIQDLHAEADLYVGHVSSKVEGLGQTVFEAMMSGLAVVAGDDQISREIIKSGENGLLVPKDDPKALEDAVVRLLEDDPLRAKLGAAARKTAEATLSFESMMKQVVPE